QGARAGLHHLHQEFLGERTRTAQVLGHSGGCPVDVAAIGTANIRGFGAYTGDISHQGVFRVELWGEPITGDVSGRITAYTGPTTRFSRTYPWPSLLSRRHRDVPFRNDSGCKRVPRPWSPTHR